MVEWVSYRLRSILPDRVLTSHRSTQRLLPPYTGHHKGGVRTSRPNGQPMSRSPQFTSIIYEACCPDSCICFFSTTGRRCEHQLIHHPPSIVHHRPSLHSTSVDLFFLLQTQPFVQSQCLMLPRYSSSCLQQATIHPLLEYFACACLCAYHFHHRHPGALRLFQLDGSRFDELFPSPRHDYGGHATGLGLHQPAAHQQY